MEVDIINFRKHGKISIVHASKSYDFFCRKKMAEKIKILLGYFCFSGISLLLFFAAYVICKKNYSFSRVVFLFSNQSKIANSSKINDSRRVRTSAFSSSRIGVRVSVVPNIFTIYPQHFLIPEISETLKGSFTKFFGTVRQKIFDGKLRYPLLCIKFFDTPNFLKH